MAGAARDAGLRGLMFDMEPYQGNPWDYASQPGRSKLDFAAFQARVRSRGAAFMRAIQGEYPAIQIYALYLLSANRYDLGKTPAETMKNLQGSTYGLWPAFVNGMLDAIGPGVSLVEGNEEAYYYLHASEFDASRREVRQTYLPLIAPANRARYSKVQMGQAIFADGVLNSWKSPRFVGYYFASDAEREQALSHNITQALRTTDEVAWFYNENFDWWATPRPGQERLRNLIMAARTAALSGKTTPPVATLGAVEAAYRARVSLGGDLLGAQAGSVSFEVNGKIYAPGDNSVCSTWNAGKRYACTFPGNWSGSVRPLVNGQAIFEPPERQYKNLKKDDWGANFKLRE